MGPCPPGRPGTQALPGWLPPFAALLFCVHPLLIWLSPEASLGDPGTGWHLVAGRQMLESGAILRADPFSYTAAGRDWVAFEWLFECGAALLHRWAGLPAVAMACAVLYGLVPVIVYKRAVRLGADGGLALAFAFAAYLVGLGHAHLRPHVFTVLFLAVFLARFERAGPDGPPPARAWLLAPVMWVWANAHPGFLFGIVLTGLYWACAALRWVRTRGPAEAAAALGWTRLLALLGAVTLLNPCGWHLHAHILETMRLKSLPLWEEFASPDFCRPDVATGLFEAMILLWIALLLGGRGRLLAPQALCLIFLLHQGLQSRRHMGLFALAAAPALAASCSAWIRGAAPRARRTLDDLSAVLQRPGREGVWLAMLAAAWLAAGALARGPGRQDLLGIRLSRGAAAFIEAHLDRMRPVFNTDDLGGALIHAFWPRLPVFVDDRNGMYGDDFIMGKYLAVYHVRTNWAGVLQEYGVRSAVVRRDAALCTLLGAAPGWSEVYSDELNRIFFRGE